MFILSIHTILTIGTGAFTFMNDAFDGYSTHSRNLDDQGG